MIGTSQSSASLACWALALTALASTAQAAYINGFESAEYVDGVRLSSITDTTSGNPWILYSSNGTFGSGIDATASTARPASGSAHIRLADGLSSANVSARIDLGASATAMLTQPVVISYKVTASAKPTEGTASVSIGDSAAFNTNKVWASINWSSSNTIIVQGYQWGVTGYNGFTARNADGSYLIVTPGTYANIRFMLDPTTYTYSSIQINGIEQLGITWSGGSIPAALKATSSSGVVLNPNTDRYLKAWSGSTNVATYDVDDVRLEAVPEPVSLSVMGLGCGLMLLRRR